MKASLARHPIHPSFVVASALALFFLIQPCAAEPRPEKHRPQDPQAAAERALETLTRELDLTEQQQVELEPILREQAEALFELRESHSGENRDSRRGPRSELREIHEQTRERLQQVLDEDQLREYRELMEQRREQHRDRAKQRPE